jgi:hypothetical protein
MTKPYSKDICTRGVAAVVAGGSCRNVAQQFSIGASRVVPRPQWFRDGLGCGQADGGRAIRASRTSATGGSAAPPRRLIRRFTAASRVNASKRQNRRPKRRHEARQGLGAGHATQSGLKIHLQTRAPALSEISSRILG